MLGVIETNLHIKAPIPPLVSTELPPEDWLGETRDAAWHGEEHRNKEEGKVTGRKREGGKRKMRGEKEAERKMSWKW